MKKPIGLGDLRHFSPFKPQIIQNGLIDKNDQLKLLG